jgi:hypothetical protein
MSAVALQIAIMATVLGSLVWLATRRGKPRGARRQGGDQSWSSDAVYNIGDAGQQGVASFDGRSGYSAGAGDSGGSDSGGGGSDGGGGGSSD